MDFNDLPAKDKIYYQDNDISIYNSNCRNMAEFLQGIGVKIRLVREKRGVLMHRSESRDYLRGDKGV